MRRGWAPEKGEALEIESRVEFTVASELDEQPRGSWTGPLVARRPSQQASDRPAGATLLLARIPGQRRAATLLTTPLPRQLSGKSRLLQGSPGTTLSSSGSHAGLGGTAYQAPPSSETVNARDRDDGKDTRHPVAAPRVEPQAGVPWPNPHPGAASRAPHVPPDGGGDSRSENVGAVPTSQVKPGPQLTSVTARPASPTGLRPLPGGWPPCAHRAFCTEGSAGDRPCRCARLRGRHVSPTRTRDVHT